MRLIKLNKGNNIMMTTEQRLAIIKAAVNKVQGNLELRAQQAKSNAKVLKASNSKLMKIKSKAELKLDKELDGIDENYNDVDTKTARKIANESVGDTYRQTIKYDNEWN
jgi:hypothetical protein